MFTKSARGSRPVRSAAVVLSLALLATFAPGGSAFAAPSLQLSADSAAPGDSLEATGSGFPKRTRGTLAFAGQAVMEFRTDRRGRISVTFSVPATADEGPAPVAAKAGTATADATLLVVSPVTETTSSSPAPTAAPTATPAPTTSPTPTSTVAASPTPAPTESPVASSDPYVRRVRAELKVFTDWLVANDASGYMGEIGWPNNQPADQDRYNALADAYITDMKAAGVRGAVWATGEWWGASYAISPFFRRTGGTSIDTATAQAPVVEKHGSQVGVHVNGGEFGSVYGTAPTSTFSNVNRGTYNQNWHYDNQASFDYLASRGVTEVVIPFRWERVQPTLGGPLDSAEITRIKDVVARAGAAGLRAVPMVANYAAYWLHDPATGKGIRRGIGSAEVPVATFADLWTKLSTALKGTAAISAYGLMREPAGLAGATQRDRAIVWEKASQAAVTAIRNNGDTEHLLVSGYQFSNTHSWPTQHPAKWISDPADNHSYEAHHYWASTYDASYKTYDEEVAFSKSKGY